MECLVRPFHTNHFLKKIPGVLLLGINNQDITFPVRFDPVVDEMVMMPVVGYRVFPRVDKDQEVAGIVFFIVCFVLEQTADLVPRIPVTYG